MPSTTSIVSHLCLDPPLSLLAMPPYQDNCNASMLDFWCLRQKSAIDMLTTEGGKPLTDLEKTGILTNIICEMSSDSADYLDTATKSVHPAYILNKTERHPQRAWTCKLLYGLVHTLPSLFENMKFICLAAFFQAKYKERYEDEITVVITIAPESKPDATLTPNVMLEHAMLWNSPCAFHEQPCVQAL
ncbi:MAG TPA: hypothetical protein VGO47_07515, partial [Chlamydiales bacterium]|nr:hypothetical protein [Chlamydiales bacterium]